MEKNLRYTGPNGTPILDTVNKIERLYQVPPSYFDGLADEIMAKVRLKMFEVAGRSAYSVPDGYFSGLAGQILQRIHSEEIVTADGLNNFRDPLVYEELKNIAPLLGQIGNQNVYEVPTGYFAGLRAADVVKANPEKETAEQPAKGKVIPLTPRKNIWRTAVAAAAIIVVIFSGQHYFTNHHDSSVPPSTGNQFASKINTTGDSFMAGMSELSDEEIIGYLSTPGPSMRDSIEAKASEETQKAISNMTNEELENYLERTPATY